MASYLTENLILPIIPVIIFGIALDRVKKFANENQDETLVMNQSMFKINLAILTIMALNSLILCITFIIFLSEMLNLDSSGDLSASDLQTYSIMQMVGFVISGIAYSTLYYLFWIFARPIKLNDIGPSQELDEGMTATPGGPDDFLENMQSHLEDTKKKHRRGTMTSH